MSIKSEDAMEKFMLRLFDEGVRLRGMDRKFQLDSIPKAQAGLIKNQESIKQALDDLRRKANVSLSKSDDIKKTLGAMKKK